MRCPKAKPAAATTIAAKSTTLSRRTLRPCRRLQPTASGPRVSTAGRARVTATPSVRHRVEHHVHANRVAGGRESIEVLAVLTLAFPRVRDVGVVRHEDDQPAVRVRDPAKVDRRAVSSALRRVLSTPLPVPEVDRGDLRDIPDIVE